MLLKTFDKIIGWRNCKRNEEKPKAQKQQHDVNRDLKTKSSRENRTALIYEPQNRD